MMKFRGTLRTALIAGLLGCLSLMPVSSQAWAQNEDKSQRDHGLLGLWTDKSQTGADEFHRRRMELLFQVGQLHKKSENLHSKAISEEYGNLTDEAKARLKRERQVLEEQGGELVQQLQALANIYTARWDLKRAETAEEKQQITKELRKALSECFDNDMKAGQQELEDLKKRIAMLDAQDLNPQQQEELENLKKRLAKLEAQFEQRKVAKAEIVDLRLKLEMMQIEGLGFFIGPSHAGTALPPQPGELDKNR